MFDRVLVKSGSNQSERFLFIPDLVDMMFYYGEVHVVLSKFEMAQLLKVFGDDVLYQLIANRLLILHPCDQHVGVGMHGDEYYSVGLYHLKNIDIENLLRGYHREICSDSAKNADFAKKYSKVLELYQYPDMVQKSIYEDICDGPKFSRLTQAFLSQYYPSYPNIADVEICADRLNSSIGLFKIDSNLSINKLNAIHEQNGYNEKFSYTTLLIAIGATAQDCYLASEIESELITNSRWGEVYKQRMNEAINRTIRSQDNIDRFKKTSSVEFLSPGTALMEGRLSPKEILDELTSQECEKFKDWLSKLPTDAELSYEYNQALKESFKQKWSIKVGRTIVQIGLGAIPIIGQILSPVVSILDTFVGDKIGKGWSPILFVDKVLNNNILKNEASN